MFSSIEKCLLMTETASNLAEKNWCFERGNKNQWFKIVTATHYRQNNSANDDIQRCGVDNPTITQATKIGFNPKECMHDKCPFKMYTLSSNYLSLDCCTVRSQNVIAANQKWLFE